MEDIRRRFVHTVTTGTHDEKIQIKLAAMELAYTRALLPTKLEIAPEETQAETLTIPETQQTRGNPELVHESTKYRSPSKLNKMLARIRKWSLKYDGGNDPIQFVERGEGLSNMSNIPRVDYQGPCQESSKASD